MALLQIENLTVAFADKLICEDFTLHIKPGEIWGILGENGSGKTTLLHTLGGFKTYRTGNILLEGKKLTHFSVKTKARKLGILFQSITPAFPETVYEYCKHGLFPHFSYISSSRNAGEKKLHNALRLVELHNKLHQPINTLSGGERQRLYIATLLVQAPLIYLLDEPTNHLDLRYQIKILDHFKYLARHQSATILMASHDINLMTEYCDQIIMLSGEGQVLMGEKRVLLTAENLLKVYHHPFKRVPAWLPLIP